MIVEASDSRGCGSRVNNAAVSLNRERICFDGPRMGGLMLYRFKAENKEMEEVED